LLVCWALLRALEKPLLLKALELLLLKQVCCLKLHLQRLPSLPAHSIVFEHGAVDLGLVQRTLL